MDARTDHLLSPLLSACFLQAVSRELRGYGLDLILGQQGLSQPLPGQPLKASEFAALQAGLRRYYGLGARGLLLRVGRSMWSDLVDGQPAATRIRLNVYKILPRRQRIQRILEFLAGLLQESRGAVTLRWTPAPLMVDESSDGTLFQQTREPVCWMTVGLIQEALHWATHVDFEIEELSCRAMGEPACQFEINLNLEEGG